MHLISKWENNTLLHCYSVVGVFFLTLDRGKINFMYLLVLNFGEYEHLIECSSYGDACSKLEMAQNTWYDENVSCYITELPE